MLLVVFASTQGNGKRQPKLVQQGQQHNVVGNNHALPAKRESGSASGAGLAVSIGRG